MTFVFHSRGRASKRQELERERQGKGGGGGGGGGECRKRRREKARHRQVDRQADRRIYCYYEYFIRRIDCYYEYFITSNTNSSDRLDREGDIPTSSLTLDFQCPVSFLLGSTAEPAVSLHLHEHVIQ